MTRRLIVYLTLIIPLVFAVSCKKAPEPRSLEALSEEERRHKFDDDMALVKRYDDGLRKTLEYARARPDLFVKSEEVQLTPRQKAELRTIWQTILDYMRALDGVKEYWKKFHEFGAIRERRAHAESFMVGYAAWLVQYRHGLDFIDLTVPSKPMEKLLDERNRKFEIPKGSFASLKWNVIHVKAVGRLLGSRQYWKTLTGAMRDFDCHQREPCNWGLDMAETYHDGAFEKLAERAAVDFSYNAFDIARDMSFDAWFPVQRGVAAWMGDTKIRRLHHHLITEAQLDDMREKLEPGDVIVARHNWYLSNVGLPGFWPHAEFYLGSPAELREYFDDPAVSAYYQSEHGADDFASFLEATFPDAWKVYGSVEEGKPRRVIEAVSEGVVFSTLERAAGADYVGVMRPTRTKLDKAAAITRAFDHFGRPYDFNFDFTTDESIVCTELVYKSWRIGGEPRPLGLDTAKVMGRITLPANDIVRQFDERCEDPDAPMEFVYFIDGREHQKGAVIGTFQQFRESWKRPKWDTMQQ